MKSIVVLGAVAFFAVGCKTTSQSAISESEDIESSSSSGVRFDCATTKKVDEGKVATFSFAVTSLDADAKYVTREGEEETPVETSFLTTLNAEGSAYMDKVGDKDALILHGDDISIVINHVVLYKNSGYKRGYIRQSEDSGTTGSKGWYSKVRCELSEYVAEDSSSDEPAGLAEYDLTQPKSFKKGKALVDVNLLDDGVPHGYTGASILLPASPDDITVNGPEIEGEAQCKMEPLKASDNGTTLMKVHAEIGAEEGTCSYDILLKDGRKAYLTIQAMGT